MNHALFGFSDADKWLICGAYTRTIAGCGEDESPAIEFGNVSHKILENRLDGKLVNKTKANEDEYDCADVAYQYIIKTLNERRGDTYAEAFFQITSTGREDLGGTGDVFLWDGKVLEYIDLKTGAGTFVSETSSPQLKLNALAFCEGMDVVPERIILTIVQPRWWGDEDDIRSTEVTHESLQNWVQEAVMPAVERNLLTDSPGIVTNSCIKCKGRHVCTYRDEAVAKGLVGDIGVLTVPGATEIAIRSNQDITVYDNDHLGNTLRLIPVIQDYCKSLQEHAQEIIMQGEKVSGFKVVLTNGRPVWVGDDDELIEKLRKSAVKEADYLKYTLRTPKQVAALKTGPNRDKPLSKAIAKTIADHTGRSEGGLALVDDNDPRESAAPQFEVITPNKPGIEPLPVPDFLL